MRVSLLAKLSCLPRRLTASFGSPPQILHMIQGERAVLQPCLAVCIPLLGFNAWPSCIVPAALGVPTFASLWLSWGYGSNWVPVTSFVLRLLLPTPCPSHISQSASRMHHSSPRSLHIYEQGVLLMSLAQCDPDRELIAPPAHPVVGRDDAQYQGKVA